MFKLSTNFTLSHNDKILEKIMYNKLYGFFEKKTKLFTLFNSVHTKTFKHPCVNSFNRKTENLWRMVIMVAEFLLERI